MKKPYYTHDEPFYDGLDYSVFYTLNLPIEPWISGLDIQKDVVDKISWHKPYRQWLINTPDLISDEYQYFVKDLGLKLMANQLVFACQEGHIGYRHRDIHPYHHWHWDDAYNSAAINYYLTPATGSMDFWDLGRGGEIIEVETRTHYESGTEHNDSKIISSWTGQDNRAPALVRTEAPHQGKNLEGPGPRVVLTLRFELNPIWWQVRAAFMPYIIQGY
jgi:hypothetical protein